MTIVPDTGGDEFYLVERVLRLLLLYYQSAKGQRNHAWKSCARSYHFAATFVELLDRLIKLLDGKRHGDAAAQDEPLSLELLQITGVSRCMCFVNGSVE